MNNQNQAFSKRLFLSLFFKLGVSLILYFVTISMAFFATLFVADNYRWSGKELLYPLLKTLNPYRELFFVLALATGLFGISAFYWFRILKYLQAVVYATNNIYNQDQTLIHLPKDLKEIEDQMNQIKLNINQSQLLAKEAEQRKNDLVVYLAHDLKTPLTSVIGYLNLLKEESQISEQLRHKYLSISLSKAERLEDLINEFFDITRFNLSNLSLETSQVNLSFLLEQLIAEFKPILADKDLSCRLIAPPNFSIVCDVAKMQRVFDNLLRNAVNYSFPNGTITIQLIPTADACQIRFINPGNVIPPEKLNRIFEQFYRLDSARTSQTGGAGLGLSIAKQIVELHGGKISAASQSGFNQFQVNLPLVGKSS